MGSAAVRADRISYNSCMASGPWELATKFFQRLKRLIRIVLNDRLF